MNDRDEARRRLDALLWLAQLGDRPMTEVLAEAFRSELADVVIDLKDEERT